MTPAEVREAVSAGAVVIDMRPPKPFATEHLPGAVNRAEKAKPMAKLPAEGESPTVTEETQRYLKYNETLINQVIDDSTWNSMPKSVKQELASLNLIVYKDGYPTLSPNAKQVLT